MPPIKEKIKERYIEGIGRRKRAVARVRITQSPRSRFQVNEKELSDYFVSEELQKKSMGALSTIEGKQHVSIDVRVRGGGKHSQAEAVCHGIARALLGMWPDLKQSLRKDKLLTRDAREKERRKFGLKKARKAPQWSKR